MWQLQMGRIKVSIERKFCKIVTIYFRILDNTCTILEMVFFFSKIMKWDLIFFNFIRFEEYDLVLGDPRQINSEFSQIIPATFAKQTFLNSTAAVIKDPKGLQKQYHDCIQQTLQLCYELNCTLLPHPNIGKISNQSSFY